MKIFSVYPPIVVQTYETESNIVPGKGGIRVQWLEDSVRDRITLVDMLNDQPDITGTGLGT
jgi:hypothetical protein